jgi:hypothetical protein
MKLIKYSIIPFLFSHATLFWVKVVVESLHFDIFYKDLWVNSIDKDYGSTGSV